LHSDIRDYDQLTQEDSLQNDLIEAVQKQLADFKASFEEFRAKQMKITQEKDGEIQRLRQELDKLSEERISIEEEKIGLA
jgi:chromosome segregation ATPase